MRFEGVFERYRAGTATPEEAAQVEEELSKFRLLTDYVAEHDELDLPPPPAQAEEGEYRKVKRRVRRSRAGTVGLAVAVTCAVLLLARLLLWPLLNTYVFYNPGREGLEQTLGVCESLFFPTQSIIMTGTENTGLGRYAVTLQQSDWASGGMVFSHGTLRMGGLTMEEDFYRSFCPVNMIKTVGSGDRLIPGQSGAEAAEKLLELPDYSLEVLCLSFSRELSMGELADLMEAHPEVTFCWAEVRVLEGDGFYLPPVGFKPQYELPNREDGAGIEYPWLFLRDYREDEDQGAVYEAHFQELLRYMGDRGQILQLPTGGPYGGYQRALEYVEEHGVYARGAFVSGRPADLAALCGGPEVSWASLRSIRLWPEMG